MKQIPLTKPKLIVFDVDKTLTGVTTWYYLTEALGGDIEQHFQLYSRYKKGELDFDTVCNELMTMYSKAHGKAITRKELYDVFFQLRLKGEAFSTFSDIKERGIALALISSSIDMFVEMVAERLQIEHWYANSQLVFNEKDEWVRFEYDRNEAELKLTQLQELQKKLDLSADEIWVVGDGRSDMLLFKNYTGIALDSDSNELSLLAWKEIKYLPSFLQLLEQSDH